MLAVLTILLGISVTAIVLLAIGLFNFKKKRLTPYILFMISVVVMYAYLFIDGSLNGTLILVALELFPVAAWGLFTLLSYDPKLLSSKWKVVSGSFFIIGGLVLVSLFFVTQEIDEFYRIIYIVPFVAFSFIFGILRIVQKGQRRAWLYLFLLLLFYILSTIFIGATPAVYSIAMTGFFAVVSMIYGFLLQPGESLYESLFGKVQKIVPKISKRTIIVMTGTFIVIFMLSFLVLYVVSRSLFMRKLETNLSFQNYVIGQSIDTSLSSNNNILKSVLSRAKNNEGAQEILADIQTVNISIKGIRIETGGKVDEKTAQSPFSLGIKRVSSELSGNALVSMHSDESFENLLFIYSQEESGVLVEMYVDAQPLFEPYGDATAYSQSSRIGLLDMNGGVISFPENGPYNEDLNNPSSILSGLCSDASTQCVGKECKSVHRRFLVDRKSFDSDLIGNATIAVPELNMCITSHLKQNETFTTPLMSEAVVIILIFIVLIITFVIVSASFERSITRPLNILYEGVKRMKAGEMSQKLGQEYDDEVGKVATIFNELVVQLNDAKNNIEKKAIERTEQLNSEREKIEVIVQSMKDGMLFISIDGKIQLFNQAATQISGFLLTEVLNTPYDQYIRIYNENNDNERINLVEKSQEREAIIFKGLLESKDNQLIPIQYSVAPVLYNKKPIGTVVIFQDMAKERELQLLNQNFASIASHQLKTPLGAVKWLFEMILEEKDVLTATHQEYIQQAFDANARMINLVDELLNVSRLESGKVKPQPSSIHIKDVIARAIEAHQKNADTHSAEVIFRDADTHLPKVYADSVLIESVLDNYLSNAIEYSRPEMHNPISIFVDVNNDMLMVSVNDEGIGVKKEDEKKLFTSFFRSDEAIRMREEGTGLGLFVSKLIVDSSGGEVGFTQKDESGALFYFTLPIDAGKGK